MKIVKEIIIMLLLTLAIILLLGLVLYDYSPANKIIPDAVSYVRPTDVREELAMMDSVNNDEIILTYEVTEQDLRNFKNVNEYVSGRKNPFASTFVETPASGEEGETTTGNQGNTGGNQGNQSGNQGGNTTNNNNQNQGFIPDRGK